MIKWPVGTNLSSKDRSVLLFKTMPVRLAPRQLAVLGLACFASALPLFILVFQTPIGASTGEEFAVIHKRWDFYTRTVLTYAYFPAVVLIHFLARPSSGNARRLFLTGVVVFVAGNAIDLAFRIVQFQLVHYGWASDYVSSSIAETKEAIWLKIGAFGEISIIVSLCYSVLLGLARIAMGAALFVAPRLVGRIAAIALIINGVWNIAPRAIAQSSPEVASMLSSLYLLPWLASIVAVSVVSFLRTSETRTVDYDGSRQ